jgi:hypothetical protein
MTTNFSSIPNSNNSMDNLSSQSKRGIVCSTTGANPPHGHEVRMENPRRCVYLSSQLWAPSRQDYLSHQTLPHSDMGHPWYYGAAGPHPIRHSHTFEHCSRPATHSTWTTHGLQKMKVVPVTFAM